MKPRRWRECFEGERYPEGVSWKLFRGGIILALQGDDAVLRLRIWWPWVSVSWTKI